METSQELTAPTWRKSSYSSSSGGDCIEVAQLPTRIAIRDSKNPEGGAFTVSPAAFSTFVDTLARRGVAPL
jgi:hypothetical protein